MKLNNTLLSNCFLVSQNPIIYNGSLLDNIVLDSVKHYDRDKIHHLIKAFDMQDWFKGLKQGLDTQLEFQSNKLSGGQIQRIVLIRALYNNPSLLLLDEATSQLDLVTEKKVMDTIVKIAHQGEMAVVMVYHKKTLDAFCSKHLIID